MRSWKIGETDNELTTFTGAFETIRRTENRYEYEYALELDPTDRNRGQDTLTMLEPDRSRWESFIAVQAVYKTWIADVVERLLMHRSVLCVCDKVLARPLYRQIEGWAVSQRKPITFAQVGGVSHLNLRALREDFEQKMVASATNLGQVLIIPHFDLLAGGDYAQEIALYLSEYPGVTVLAFSDPDLPLAPAIRDLFAEVRELPGVTRDHIHLIIRPEEARRLTSGCLEINDQIRLFQMLSGMNVIQIRRLMTWLYQTTVSDLMPGDAVEEVYQKIRSFTTGIQTDAFGEQAPDLESYDEEKKLLIENVIQPIQQRTQVSDSHLATLYDQVTPRGVLLFGPPRNGKTEFARWLAHQLRAPLIAIRGPELKNMYHGETERAIRRIFAQARRSVPSIILIDEIDSLTPTRSNRSEAVTVSIVSTLLTEMDGLGREESILVIGTTNRIQAVDPAFLAPGRFSLQVLIDYPGEKHSRAIIAYYARKWDLQLAKETLDAILRGTTGYLDPSAEFEREQLRDALLQSRFTSQAVKTGGEALKKMIDAELDPLPKWSCDHLRGVMQRFLRQKLQNQQDPSHQRPLDDPDFVSETLAIVRGDTAALYSKEQTTKRNLGSEL